MSPHIHAAALTDTGRVRTNNEDTFGMDEALGLYVVCDGMGGAAGGEIASRMACDTLLEHFSLASDTSHQHESEAHPQNQTLSVGNLEERLRAAIAAANIAVWRAGRGDQHHNMGTTLVAAAFTGDRLLVGNVGDSRAYLLTTSADVSGWRQVTRDHSYINELVQTGSIRASDRDAPELQRFGSMITRAIGATGQVQPEFFSFTLHDGDMVLLCSDGLTRYLDEADFDAMIDASALEASCERLIERANKRGGVDNITCMLLRYAAHDSA